MFPALECAHFRCVGSTPVEFINKSCFLVKLGSDPNFKTTRGLGARYSGREEQLSGIQIPRNVVNQLVWGKGGGVHSTRLLVRRGAVKGAAFEPLQPATPHSRACRTSRDGRRREAPPRAYLHACQNAWNRLHARPLLSKNLFLRFPFFFLFFIYFCFLPVLSLFCVS